MNTTQISIQIVRQLYLMGISLIDNTDNDYIFDAWYNLLTQINSQSKIKAFQLPNSHNGISITIIEFESLPLVPNLREEILRGIEQWNDEPIDYKFLDHNTLIVRTAS